MCIYKIAVVRLVLYMLQYMPFLVLAVGSCAAQPQLYVHMYRHTEVDKSQYISVCAPRVLHHSASSIIAPCMLTGARYSIY